jgi:DNA-binding IclR family transcriptional regulator
MRLAGKTWRLGPAASRLGSMYRAASDLGRLVEPAVQSLVRQGKHLLL